jgi:hypothetical protein
MEKPRGEPGKRWENNIKVNVNVCGCQWIYVEDKNK